MFQIVLGKCKSLVQQVNDEKIEPTPNYDCHIPQVQARPSDNFSVQLARSQVLISQNQTTYLQCYSTSIIHKLFCLPFF